MSKITIEYDNDVGPGDEGFWEWWEVHENGEYICKCNDKETAERIKRALENEVA